MFPVAAGAKEFSAVEEYIGGDQHLVTDVANLQELLWLDRSGSKHQAAHPGYRFQIFLNFVRHIIKNKSLGPVGGESPPVRIGREVFAFGIAEPDLNAFKI